MPPSRKTIALTADQADKNLLCIRCHDEENSTKFDFTKYWGQIVHKGAGYVHRPGGPP